MSAPKFASMTASLLARKGDALPSIQHDAGIAAVVSRPLSWANVSTSPPPVLRQFESLNSAFSQPPADVRAAESSTHVSWRDRRVASAAADVDANANAKIEEGPVVAVPVATSGPKQKPISRRAAKAAEPDHITKPRRLFVSLSPEDYERLGIMAVKRDTTRHQLLRDTLDRFLQEAAQDAGECACIAGECKSVC